MGTETTRLRRWQAAGAEVRGGRRVALIIDRTGQQGAAGELVRVYHRLGRWRYYADDRPVADRALAATARRALERS